MAAFPSAGRWPIAILIALDAIMATGCGSGLKTVPVRGRIVVNGEVLTRGDVTIVFRPDQTKRNALRLDFSGMMEPDGTYCLYHGDGLPGAVPGWYQVAVVATEPAEKGSMGKKAVPGPPVRKSLIDRKYTLASTSGITIEVVENPRPGAYDLHLTGPIRN
jgi:hypothetical protein